ncbi:hypothetical protein BO71DRAFT_393762 [Aspergillus ellipticus CBS 707.79]|uniref:Rhodopsin domain-containing protein n=1 Tax=Aspergillus ellipticus CBS 707.79 TaxID=1448320 RepID=A0A319E8Z3_9EURO|nr:hypothetical protein BO71DRAFT_393762 [Aspergillus ellipticus CBS 707.79]
MTTVSSDYESQNKGPRILAVFWILTGLATVAVSARLFIRMKILRNPGADDWLVAVSMVFSLSYAVLSTVNVALGFGQHSDTMTNHRLQLVLLLNNIGFALGIVAFAIPKLAVAALLNRFLNPTALHRAIFWGLTGFVALVSFICIVVLFTSCSPARALWDTSLLAEGAKCRTATVLVSYATFTGAASAFTDLYLAIYPTIILLKLHMVLWKKLALCGALGLGVVACAMAIIKCMQLPELGDLSDATYTTADLVIWTCIESNVVILASCIPTLQPLIEVILGKRTLRSTKGYQYKEDGSHLRESTKWTSKPSGIRKDDPDLTITGVGSQESILQMGQIRRTDNVTVEYERPSEHTDEGQESSTSWEGARTTDTAILATK